MKKTVIPGVVFNAVLLILVICFSMLDKNTLIITIGIVFANVVLTGGWILIAAVFAAGNIVWIVKLLKNRKKKILPEYVPLEFSEKERMDPEQIREELRRFNADRSLLRNQIAEALAQMDSMDRKQAKMDKILQRNQISTLDEVVSTIDGTEQSMFRNIQKIINRMILWDPMEWNKPGKEEIYAGHLKYIKKILAYNDEMLSKCDILMGETVNYIDEKDSGADTSGLHLEAMTKTIQSLRQINSVEL